MSKKKSIIVCCLGFLILTISNAYSSATYFSLNNKEEICQAVKMGKISFPYRTDTFQSYEKLFIPPHLTSLMMRTQVEAGQGNLKISLKYVARPNEYPPHYDQYSHTVPAHDPIKSIDQMREEHVIRVGGEQNDSFSIFNIGNTNALKGNPDGDWLYVNVFDGQERISSIEYAFLVDAEPFIKWCSGNIGGPAGKPNATQNQIWLSSPRTINVSSIGAERICYTVNTTSSIGSEPSDPETPRTPTENDVCFDRSSVDLILEANPGEYKKYKYNFRARNGEGLSDEAIYLYGLDRRPLVVGKVMVDPASGQIDGTSLTLRVTAQNATQIRYQTIERVSSSGEPPDPDPNDLPDLRNANAGVISGSSGTLTLQTNSGNHKKVIIRFVGFNENNPIEKQYGEVSGVYAYSLKGSTVQTGNVSVYPSGGSFNSHQDVTVSSENSTRIYYKYTLNYQEPQDPDFSSSRGMGPKGVINIPAESRKTSTVKMKFRGYNERSDQWGPVSKTYSYTINLSDSPAPPQPTPPPGKQECENQGGTWVEILGKGFCINIGQNPQPKGSIKIMIEPQQAVEDGARWGVTWLDMRKSGDTIELNPGTYELIFEDIEGWIATKNIRVEIFEDLRRNMIVNYKRPQNLSYGESIPFEVIQKFHYRLDNAFRNPENGRIDLSLRLIMGQSLKHFMESLLSQTSELLLDWREKQGEIHIYFKNNPHSLVLKLIATEVYTTAEPNQVRIDKCGDWLFIYDGISVILSPVWADLSVRDFLEEQLSSKIEEGLVFIHHNSGGQDMVFKFDFEYQDPTFQSDYIFDVNECLLKVSTESGKQQTFIPFIHDFNNFEKLLNDYGLRARVFPYPHPGQIEILTHDYQSIYKGSPDCRINYNQTSEKATLDILNDQNNDEIFGIVFMSPMGSQIIYSTP